MAAYRFRILNVFTRGSEPLSGNPLCVFENGSAFDTAAMQALARQFNLSETTFLLPATTGHARVRIFTPTFEMPFAGHPTLGTAHVCRNLGLGRNLLELEMQAGLIHVRAAGDRWTLTAPQPTWREFDSSIEALAAALKLDAREIGDRPLWVKAGTEQLVVPLTSPGAVQRALPHLSGCASLAGAQGAVMVYLFAENGSGKTLARFFFSQGAAMMEDPATGSATANFGGWCLAMQRALPIRYEISQGEMVSRPSSLYLEVDANRRIHVGGDVIEIAAGELTLPGP